MVHADNRSVETEKAFAQAPNSSQAALQPYEEPISLRRPG
jgi:hypothetical protein